MTGNIHAANGNAATSAKRDWPVLALLVGLWLAIWCATVPLGNNPLNDDWVFGAAAKSIVETGRFTAPGFLAPNLIAQAYWGALFCLPFGFSFEALRLSTAVLCTGGVVATYMLLRELGASRTAAVIAALTLATNPIYINVATSFMTDGPFTAVFVIALWLYVRGAKRERDAWIVAAYLLAFTSILLRQFALALLVGFGVAHLFRRGLKWRAITTAVVPVLLGLCLHFAYQHWAVATGRTHFIGRVQDLSGLQPRVALPKLNSSFLQSVPYFGLFVGGFFLYAALCARRASDAFLRSRWFWGVAVLLAAVLLDFVFTQNAILPALGNIINVNSVGVLTLRDTYMLHMNRPQIRFRGAHTFCVVATVFGVFVAAVLALVDSRVIARCAVDLADARRRQQHWPVALMLGASGAYLAATYAAGILNAVFDRYLIVVIAPACAVLFLAFVGEGPWRPWRIFPPSCVLLMSGTIGVLATHDYLAWNRARWRAVDFLLREGVSPSRIEGGYEFGGWYLYKREKPMNAADPDKSWWWTEGEDYMIANGPLDDYEKVKEFTFSHWFWKSDASVFVLRRH